MKATLKWLPVLAILFFLFAPVLVVVVFAFNAAPSTALPLKGLSFKWFSKMFGDDEYRTAMWNSATVAVATMCFSLCAGTAAGFALSRRRSRLLDALMVLIVSPLVLPGLLIGSGLLLLVTELHLEPSLFTVFTGHALVTLPFVVLVVNARLTSFDRSVVEAARDLGASAPVAFRRIVFPAIAPALAGAALLSLAWSLDEFVITLFTNGGWTTVPVLIYSQARLGLEPTINAVATMVLATTFAAALVASRFLLPSELSK